MAFNNKPARNIYLRFGKDVVKRQTEKAILFNVEINGQPENIWLPKSQLIHFAEEGENVVITIPEWLMTKNNLDMYIDEEWVAMGCPD